MRKNKKAENIVDESMNMAGTMDALDMDQEDLDDMSVMWNENTESMDAQETEHVKQALYDMLKKSGGDAGTFFTEFEQGQPKKKGRKKKGEPEITRVMTVSKEDEEILYKAAASGNADILDKAVCVVTDVTRFELSQEQIAELHKKVRAMIPYEENVAADELIIAASQPSNNSRNIGDISERITAYKRITPRDQVTICLAARSGDLELEKAVNDVVYRLMIRLIVKQAHRMKNGTYTECGDLINGAYVTIREQLGRYDGIHTLSTFFMSFVKAGMLNERFDNSAVPFTKYERDIKFKVSEAVHAMQNQEEPNMTPTAREVYDWIRFNRGYSVPYKSIERMMDSDGMITSLENLDESSRDYRPFKSGDETVLAEEQRNEVEKAIERMPKRYRDAIRLYWEMILGSQKGTVENRDYIRAYHKYIDEDVRPEVIVRCLADAKRKFSRQYGHINDGFDTDLEAFRFDESEIEEETKTIMEALKDESVMQNIFMIEDDIFATGLPEDNRGIL